jgi:hypothetical protein
MNERIRRGFVDIVPSPNEFEYLLRAGKRNGKEETKDERDAAIELMLENCRCGGRIGGKASGEVMREAFCKFYAEEPMTKKEDDIVKSFFASLGDYSRKRSKLAAAARGDSDELLELVCTRQVERDGLMQQCGGTTKSALTAMPTCPSCKVQSHDTWLQ